MGPDRRPILRAQGPSSRQPWSGSLNWTLEPRIWVHQWDSWLGQVSCSGPVLAMFLG